MGMVHYVKPAARRQLMVGETPAWIRNSKRSKYIASVCLSAPPWVNRKELLAMNETAAALTKASGVLHVMDHIVPVNHPLVCGLTVPWNLQIITWRQNAAKSNKWNPDQLELF